MMRGSECFVPRWVRLALIFLLVASYGHVITEARSSGAPVSSNPEICSSMLPGHYIPPSISPSPYTMTADVSTFSASQQITVSITTASGSPGFKGILLQMRQVDNDGIVGTWNVAASDTNFQAGSCDGASNNVVTHRNSAVKDVTNEFVWTAPATKISDVKVVATFVQRYQTFWVKVQGPTIQNVNPCDPNPCLSGGTCQQTGGGFTCNCPPPYAGPTCHLIDVNPCDSNPCLSGGTCQQTGGGFTCNCPPPFAGPTCHLIVFPCNSDPCENGGTCDNVNQDSEFVCSCPPGYTGTMCELQESNPCTPDPCQSGGTCQESDGGFTCTCPPLRAGPTCHHFVFPCDSNPCQHEGTCENVNQDSEFVCSCPPGFTGTMCELQDNPCDSTPCLNGGACTNVEQNTAFSCACGDTGFKGSTCDEAVACHSNPCTNGGTCIGINQENDYTCDCPLGYTGLVCETAVSPCVANSCENGATCNGAVGETAYTCTCPADHTGTLCETSLATTPASVPTTPGDGPKLTHNIFIVATAICVFLINFMTM
eukprot:XP_003730204.1 PREDICTED: fibropellin-1 isoform X1 [Strongylocentrotus purpuratus]